MMFREKLRAASQRNNSFLCVGLDPDPELIGGRHLPGYLQAVIESTLDLVCAYKPNLAFFEALGPSGMNLLIESLAPVPKEIPIIADVKRGDIGNTARFYARALFEAYDFDAATVNAYGGWDAVEPFLAYADRGVFVWCRSSNPGSADLQDQRLADGRPLYEAVAELARSWNTRGNVGLVMGATYPEELARVRGLCPDMLILVPGVGAQAGDLAASVRAALDERGGGIIINASRQVVYASTGADFARAARRAAEGLRDEINRERKAALAAMGSGGGETSW
ncbi:MAG: orotidine-5'-phosphate decarboxylase [Chloroflexi bacterium]|nr:orotidine-5'-phosphate decarboxylase [Chloroflexota bacterium]